MRIDIVIKIVLAILFFICLLELPYGYFQFVRFIALVGFGFLAYQAFELKNNAVVVIYIVLAVLFQPFFKISLGRELWNVVDVIVGIRLIVSILVNSKE